MALPRAQEPRAGRKPLLAFAYRADRADSVLTATVLEQLARTCAIASAEPLDEFTSPASRVALAETEILVTSWGCPRIDEPVLALCPNLRLIAHAAGSIKGFIAPEVFEAGIAVCNAAGANALPVAEYTLAAILMANKQILRFRDAYRQRREAPALGALSDPTVGNYRRTVGIVGYSRIGARVIELLEPFDLSVLLYDPHGPAAGARSGVVRVELDELLRRSDVVSLHAPAIESTRHMIDARRLGLMRDGTTLINTARGALVDQEALERELLSRRLSAVIDVTSPEVLPKDSPLYDLPNVLLTPHIAGSIGNERERLGLTIAAEVERFIQGLPLAHAVLPETLHLQA